MATNKLMKSLQPSDREQLMHAFKKMDFGEGETIIKQGDKGDLFYILDSGSCDISIEGKGTVLKASRGVAFGELALLHNAPRAATVKTESKVVAWSLDEVGAWPSSSAPPPSPPPPPRPLALTLHLARPQVSFKMILMGKSQTEAAAYQGFIKEVGILKELSDSAVAEMASCLKEQVYPAGANIICEGEEGNNFFIIREGEVQCTKVGKGEVSRRLKRADFFGELALISADKRAATVTAVAPTTVLTLTREQFTRLLGPLQASVSAAGSEAYLK